MYYCTYCKELIAGFVLVETVSNDPEDESLFKVDGCPICKTQVDYGNMSDFVTIPKNAEELITTIYPLLEDYVKNISNDIGFLFDILEQLDSISFRNKG